MKTHTLPYLLLIILGTCFISCNDDDEQSKNKKNILGVWEATEVRVSECSDSDSNSDIIKECTSSNCIQYTFSTDTTDSQLYYKAIVTTGVLNGESGYYSVGDNKITFCIETEDGDSCYVQKMEVNASFLALSSTDDDTGCKEEIFFSKVETD